MGKMNKKILIKARLKEMALMAMLLAAVLNPGTPWRN